MLKLTKNVLLPVFAAGSLADSLSCDVPAAVCVLLRAARDENICKNKQLSIINLQIATYIIALSEKINSLF